MDTYIRAVAVAIGRTHGGEGPVACEKLLADLLVQLLKECERERKGLTGGIYAGGLIWRDVVWGGCET